MSFGQDLVVYSYLFFFLSMLITLIMSSIFLYMQLDYHLSMVSHFLSPLEIGNENFLSIF